MRWIRVISIVLLTAIVVHYIKCIGLIKLKLHGLKKKQEILEDMLLNVCYSIWPQRVRMNLGQTGPCLLIRLFPDSGPHWSWTRGLTGPWLWIQRFPDSGTRWFQTHGFTGTFSIWDYLVPDSGTFWFLTAKPTGTWLNSTVSWL